MKKIIKSTLAVAVLAVSAAIGYESYNRYQNQQLAFANPLLEENINALSDTNGGSYRYPHLLGKPKSCTLYHYLFLIPIFFILVSCNETSLDTKCPTINVELTDNVEEFGADTILTTDSAELIPLQSTDNRLIGNVEIFKSDGERIAIVDDNYESIYIFSVNGTLVNVIHSVGKANSEYFEIADICLEKDFVYILDYRKRVVLKYTIRGEFVKSINIEKYWGNQMACKNGLIYLINDYSPTDIGNYEVFVIDENGNLINKYLPFEFTYMATPPVSCLQNNDEIMIVSQSDNTIYEVKEDKCSPIVRLDYGNKQMSEKFKKNDLRNLAEEKVLDKYILGIKRFRFSDKIIIIDFDYDSEEYTLLYNRITGKSTLTKGFIVNSNYRVGLSNYYISGEYVYEIMDAPTLLFTYDAVFKQKDYLQDPYKSKLDGIVRTLKDSDNPVIFRYKLK